MKDIDILLNLKTSGLSKTELSDYIQNYIVTLQSEIYKNEIYTEIITKISNTSIQNICKLNEDTQKFEVNLPKNNFDELYLQFKKIKSQLEASNSLIEQLKLKNATMQTDSSIQNEKYNKSLKLLNDEIKRLNSDSQIENYKSYIHTLYTSRENISLSDLTEVEQMTKQEQIKIELEIIKSLFSLLKDLFENLYENSEFDISFEADIIVQNLYDSRSRLSMFMKKEDYLVFLISYQKDLKHILELLHRKCKKVSIQIELNSYEKWISNNKDYLFSCEKHSDMYQRLIYLHIPSNTLSPFQLYDNFTEIHFSSDMKDLMQNLLISSRDINNICFIQNDCFLVLNCITDTNKLWTYDCYLVNTIRNLSKKMTPLFISEFRKFYKDCFSHNNYIVNFEEILNTKQIKRWKHYKILYENIRILGDEYMFGEIVRDIIRKNCQYKIQNTDIVKGNKNGAVIKDFKEAQDYFSKERPYIDEQEYFVDMFDDLSGFNEKQFNAQYLSRWKEFLKVYYK